MSEEKNLEKAQQERTERLIKELTERGIATARTGQDRVWYFSIDMLLKLLAKAEDSSSDHVALLVQNTDEDDLDEVEELTAGN